MNQLGFFDKEVVLPDDRLSAKEKTLLGFATRYARVRSRFNLLLNMGELRSWNAKHHGGRLALCQFVEEEYPLAIFYGDIGTGKTATAECIANRLVIESRTEDSVLFSLSNRVRGSGKVGEMGSLLAEAFRRVKESAGRERRAVLIIDEGDSLAAARSQEHSHHEDKVAVNTLIQGIDDLRNAGGRVVTILCTNRVTALDPAFRRRAAVIEEFCRPNEGERRQLFEMDLEALKLSTEQLEDLVAVTGGRSGQPPWTYSDIRTRLYPSALAVAFPDRALTVEDLQTVAAGMEASPVIEDH